MILHVIGDLWRVNSTVAVNTAAATCSLEDHLDIFHKVEGLIKNMCGEYLGRQTTAQWNKYHGYILHCKWAACWANEDKSAPVAACSSLGDC